MRSQAHGHAAPASSGAVNKPSKLPDDNLKLSDFIKLSLAGSEAPLAGAEAFPIPLDLPVTELTPADPLLAEAKRSFYIETYGCQVWLLYFVLFPMFMPSRHLALDE